MLTLFLCLFSLSYYAGEAHHNAYQYCLCGHNFIDDPEQEYNSSAMANLENACYLCSVTNASSPNPFYFSGSLPYLGYLTCEEVGALEARTSECTSIGGIVLDCVTTSGTNQTESTGCGTIASSVAATTTSTSMNIFAFSSITVLLYMFI